MKILVTNDDGIYSEGLAEVVRWATKLGEVCVSAPATQQSGKSHATTLHQNFLVERINLGLGEKAAFCVHGTPVDCVRFAILGAQQQFDLVISGVNKGFNVGEDILYSGTVAAIFEAKLRDTCGIALSTSFETFQYVAPNLDRIWKFFQDNKLFESNLIYNVNIPPQPKEIVLTHQGGAYFSDKWVDNHDGTWQQQGYCVHQNNHDISLDTDATVDGYISVSPLSVDRSDVDVWKKLKAKIS